jgi:purine-binding chemotaxis protein CheW
MADKQQPERGMPEIQSVPLGGEVPVVVPDGLTPDAVTQILQVRARALAQPPLDEALQAKAQIQVLTFALGSEVYAVEAKYVEGIYFAERLVPVPCTPDFVVGVMNVRGRILSVIDLHRFMGLQGLSAGDGAQVVATAVDYTRGVTPDMLVLLDLQALLGDDRIIVQEKVG